MGLQKVRHDLATFIFTFTFVFHAYIVGIPSGSTVKNLPAIQEMQVRSLGWEDPLKEGMETHSSTLAWEIPWIEETGRLQSMGLQRVGHD